MSPNDPVSLGIRVIELLDSANYSSTYKFATLLGLIEAIRESGSTDGSYPDVIRGADLAEKVFELYWYQSVPYQGAFGQKTDYLKQSPQRDIPQLISEYRTTINSFSRNASLEDAQSKDPEGIKLLRREVHQRVLKMPIPRLQKLGGKEKWTEDRFIFDYEWEEDKIPKNDSLYLREGVAKGLMQIRPLLRPYIEALWANYVAARNPLLTDASHLRDSLFGAIRIDTSPLREPLRGIQNGLCFYCESEVAGKGDVDHFFAFAHFTNEDLDNFVLACSSCNNSKSDSLPALKFLKKLLARNQSNAALDALEMSLNWPRKKERVVSVACAAYLNGSTTKLWVSPGSYEEIDPALAASLLADFQFTQEN